MISMRKTLVVALVLAATLSVIGGCAHRGSATSPSPPTGALLEGTRWQLSEWTLGGQISGSSGVNSYGGPYTIGPGDAFSTGPLAVTLIGGSGPAMRAESAYLTLLREVKTYKWNGGKLTLFDAGGNESLIFDYTGK
jgi:hypothetical protein